MMYLTAFLSFGLCLAITPLVRFLALRNGWMAQPKKDRWHKKPTALMGGIAIYIGVAAPLFYLADFGVILPYFTSARVPVTPALSIPVMFLGASFLFGLGLIDDFANIKPQTKLVGQILVASMVAFLGFRLHWFTSMTIDTMVTIIWIIGVTNAFNLIDNMDGLCAGIAGIAALYFAALLQGITPDIAQTALIIAGSLIGFLVYNFNPAAIFMGDCGSLVVGFLMAMLGLNYSLSDTSNVISSIAVPVMVLMVPILDTTMVTLIRLLSGRKASMGGRDHTSHRLVLLGFSEKGAVLSLYVIGAISGITAIFVGKTDTLTSPAVIIPLGVSIVLMGIYLAQIRVYPEKEFSVLLNRPYTPILIELTYKNHIVLVLLDFCLIAFSYYLSYRLRFDSEAFPYYFKVFLNSLPAVIAVKFIALFSMGIYKGFWRFMSTDDVFLFIKASIFATLLSVATVTYLYRFKDFSKGIFMIDWLLTTGLLLGTRGFFRISGDIVNRKTLSGDRVLIYGAGRGGELLLREILNNKKHRINPIGFIDDDPLKKGKKLQGCQVLGTSEDFQALVEKHAANGLLISFNHHNHHEGNNIDTIKKICKNHGLFVKQFSIELQDVDIE